jgi:hypothetical protein
MWALFAFDDRILVAGPMSFAYTNSSAKPQSQFAFQPLISYTLGRRWYVKSADSTTILRFEAGAAA